MTASQKKPWTKFVKRAILPGRVGGESTPYFRGEAAYVRRLRRVERVLLHLLMESQLPDKVLDKMMKDMLEVIDAGRGENEGNEVSLSHEDSSDGKAEGETGAL